jgi:chromosomal replication initiation ATPase DnaA
MKHEIFKHYVTAILKLYRIDKDELFEKTKDQERVDARHLLYYLCKARPMSISTIVEYLKEEGFSVEHSTVIHGIKQMQKRMAEDRDYVRQVKKIEQSI